MTASIVPNGGADIRRNRIQIADQLLEGLFFQIGFSGDSLVQIGDVGVVMFAVMNFHRLGINVRFESFFRVG
jgi:hypothetical protein